MWVRGCVSVPDVVYVPVLKGRQGEFAALADIQPTTRQRILPLLEIVPGQTDDGTEQRAVIDRTTRKLRIWAGSRLMLDTGLLATDVDLGNNLGVVGYAAAKASAHGVLATPVVRLNDDERAQRDAAASHAEYGGGVALRLNAEDLDEDPEDTDEALADLLEILGVTRADVDLVLDLGPVSGDLAVRSGSRLPADMLRDLTAGDGWRRLMMTA